MAETRQAFLDFSYENSGTPTVEQGSRYDTMSGTQISASSSQAEIVPKAFDNRAFSLPSTWEPPIIPPVALEVFTMTNELELSLLKTHSPLSQNLSKAERQALDELANNAEIVIKSADKGSAEVIMDRQDYIDEGLRQLSDENFYVKLDECPTKKHNDMIGDKIQDILINGEISQKTAEYLHISEPRTAQLYLLPKIHKGKSPPLERPIISANECPTERISQLVDHFLQPHIPKIKSWVRDSGHCIQLLRKIAQLPPGSILSALDVVCLYPNIDQEEAIECIHRFLMEHGDPTELPSTESLVDLLKFVLKLNNFQFNGENYIQIGGTAMGTKVAPSLANVFMSYFEEKYIYSHDPPPDFYIRFLDDILIGWSHGKEKFDEFVN